MYESTERFYQWLIRRRDFLGSIQHRHFARANSLSPHSDWMEDESRQTEYEGIKMCINRAEHAQQNDKQIIFRMNLARAFCQPICHQMILLKSINCCATDRFMARDTSLKPRIHSKYVVVVIFFSHQSIISFIFSASFNVASVCSTSERHASHD